MATDYGSSNRSAAGWREGGTHVGARLRFSSSRPWPLTRTTREWKSTSLMAASGELIFRWETAPVFRAESTAGTEIRLPSPRRIQTSRVRRVLRRETALAFGPACEGSPHEIL